ncbi:MAG TPA: hypothetical protein ENH82_09635 [bacterium]|nr:hypothetical protein [bacterium]
MNAQESDWKRDKILLEFERATFLNRPSVMLNLTPYPDGKAWCVLYGNDIMSGVCGFGDTPNKAMHAFDIAWDTE